MFFFTDSKINDLAYVRWGNNFVLTCEVLFMCCCCLTVIPVCSSTPKPGPSFQAPVPSTPPPSTPYRQGDAIFTTNNRFFTVPQVGYWPIYKCVSRIKDDSTVNIMHRSRQDCDNVVYVVFMSSYRTPWLVSVLKMPLWHFWRTSTRNVLGVSSPAQTNPPYRQILLTWRSK